MLKLEILGFSFTQPDDDSWFDSSGHDDRALSLALSHYTERSWNPFFSAIELFPRLHSFSFGMYSEEDPHSCDDNRPLARFLRNPAHSGIKEPRIYDFGSMAALYESLDVSESKLSVQSLYYNCDVELTAERASLEPPQIIRALCGSDLRYFHFDPARRGEDWYECGPDFRSMAEIIVALSDVAKASLRNI